MPARQLPPGPTITTPSGPTLPSATQPRLRMRPGSDRPALRQVERGDDVGTGASMCKLYCSEMVGRVADRAVQIHGGMGLVRSYPVERFYRDIRHYRIGEGASEIQRMLIAKDVLRDVGARR